MPSVPKVPGVPPLSSYSVGAPALMFADALSAVRLFVPALWGVFLNGAPVIVPASPALSFAASVLSPLQNLASFLGAPNVLPVVASTVDFEYVQEFPIADYPQEEGAFQSYNKVKLPFDVKVSVAGGGSTTTRQSFIDTCIGIANSMSLFDVVTPEKIFTSVNVAHVDWRRNARRGVTLIIVDLWFKQISASAVSTFTTTQSPAEAGQTALGTVQSQPLPAPVAKALPAGGFL